MTYEYDNSWTERLPKSLRIGNLIYSVEIMQTGYERESQRFGECVTNDQVIRLGVTQKEQKARDTLLHEVMHAIWWVYNISRGSESGTEEAACTMLPVALMEFKRNNPEAWTWIFGE